MPSRLLIISLLAVVLYLPGASGQQPGTVNVRQRVTKSTAGLPIVNVNVDRNRVPVNDEVTFTLSPANVIVNHQYTITLQFGDGRQTQTHETQVIHRYRHPGNYRYSISIRSSDPKGPQNQTVPGVTLSATPAAVATNQTVKFNARLSADDPRVKYRFVFDDGASTGWQDEPETKHQYSLPRTYFAYVDIGEAIQGSVKRLGGSIRQPIQVTGPGPPQTVSVSLSARPVKIDARQVVSFRATVPSRVANLRYRFVFGDQAAATVWQVSPQARHRYVTAGTYWARVDVRPVNDGAGTQSASSSPLLIEVKAVTQPVVSLTASPASVIENVPVFFRATLDSPKSNIRYRFNFGDDSPPTVWASKSIATHAYSRRGKYAPFVEIGRSGAGPIRPIASSASQIAVDGFFPPDLPKPSPSPSSSVPGPVQSPTGTPPSSPAPGTPTPTLNTSSPSPGTNSNSRGTTSPSPATPTPTPSPTPTPTPAGAPSDDWWIYVFIALGLFAAYQIWKWLTTPRPTFHSRFDPGVSKTESDLAIDFQMQLKPDIAAGEYELDTDEASLIKSERKSDD